VAVDPCRKALPPTGPISPPQKKPARASVLSARGDDAGVVVGLREHVRPTAVAGEEERPGRPGMAERAAERVPEVCVRRGRVADEEAQGRPTRTVSPSASARGNSLDESRANLESQACGRSH
jgi:hypothetical protein